MDINSYINQLNTRFKSGISKEHAYRSDLENLIREFVKGVEITNEPANVTDCGNPDFVITRKKIPIGYIEAKDIGKDLNSKSYKEQFTRYKKALDNLIITDYLWFQFYQHGQLIHEIKIGEIEEGKILPLNDNFSQFEGLIKDFCSFIGQTIKSSKKLAEMMAAKARLLENILERAVTSDEVTQENSSLKGQYESFKHILIHDLTPKAFADIYAQTLAYGMFAARLHDPSLESFSRQEAAELIPKTNPFLRKLFQYVAGYDIDERIQTTVDNLAEVFRATDVKALLKNFGQSTLSQDPIIHFYETFLSEYDPKLRKSRGVWYTPEPVVNFIVRAVDDILKSEFDLPDGIADTSKTKIKLKTQTKDKRTATGFKEIEQEVHKVQILDPATGTGTFLAEVIKHIYNSRFQTMQGAWNSYVDEHLIPRLNGFELLMASYSMAHLKLDMLLTETGYKSKKNQRFNIYLTNSLEEHHPDTGTLFAQWLSSEANEANHIKRDTPVMVVMGNPPYSVSSSNKSRWIEKLIEDYKKNLLEKSYNSLSDDYVKFIRYGQHYVEKNGSGILAFITNNSFIDGIVFRQMRRNLLECFNSIYILDLHGNAKKKEVCIDGTIDQNVFDIMQGVSINILIKTKKKKEECKLFNFDLFGKRESKYIFLMKNNLNSIKWNEVKYSNPNYFFVNKNFENIKIYEEGIKIDELFKINSVGIVTSKDAVLIGFSRDELINQVERHYEISVNQSLIHSVDHRTFDKRFIYYDTKLIDRARHKVMKHLQDTNVALIIPKQAIKGFNHVFVGNSPCDKNYIDSAGQYGAGNVFPLYIYSETHGQQIISQLTKRVPNLKIDIINKVARIIGLTFVPEKEPKGNVCYLNNSEVRPEYKTTFAPIDVLDYIYAVLHSPSYREKYQEFLKIDFPRVPYPKNAETFWQLVEMGGELRQVHLLEAHKVNQFITQYPIDGTNQVDKIRFEVYEYENIFLGEDHPDYLGAVYINDTQYFADVPLSAWEFYIGGYQPAQKWLKDRRGRTLSFEDILHYQKIIVALTETVRLMQEVDKISIE